MATLTLDEFLTKARPLNPDYTDNELIQAYQDRYTTPPTQTVSAAPLMTLDEFLPKARKLNPDYSDEELTSAWQEKYGDRGAREKDQGDTVRGFKESFQQVPQMAAGLAAGAGAVGEKIFGEGGLSTALKNTGIKNYREVEQDIARDSKPSDSLSEAYNMARAGNSGALVDWLQHGLGYVGGQGLQALATAGIGYAGGKLLLKPAAETLAQKLIAKESARIAGTEAGARLTAQELTKQATSNVAGKIGQVAALGSVATGMEGGEIHGDLVSQAEQEGRSLTGWELAKAFAASLGAGALEFVGDKIGVDLLLGKSIANRLAKTRLGNVAAGAAVGAVAESGTEALQTPIEQLGKGQDPTSPESVRETIDSAALGALGGTAMGATGGAFTRPQGAPAPTVTERTPDEMGLGQHASAEQSPAPTSPFQIEGFPQAGEVRKGRVYGGGPVLDVSPLPDVSPILKAGSLDDAIAGAVGVVQGATETAKARAAEFARMTAKAKNETDALLANAPEKRPAFDVPTLPKPEAQPATLFNQPSLIVPGQAFTPRPEPIDDPRDRLAEERARMVAQREQQRMQQQANPVSETVAPAPAVQQTDTPLPSQIDLAYPSSKKVRDLIHEKGLHLDTPVFREILKQTVKKEQFADLTPQELQTLAEAVQKINAPQQPTPLQEAPPQVPLTPTEPKEKPYAPVTTIPEAQVPRSELTPEKNTEMLLRAEKAKADLEIAGTERGGRFQLEQTGTGSTNEVRGLKSATADWYKDLTSGPSPAIRGDRKQSAREKIEVAIQKIIKDQGADRGRAVEQVKAALLQDQEFHQTPWGKDLNSAIQGEWPGWIEKPQVSTQATENAQEFQKVPKSEDSNETVRTVPSKSGQIDSENARLVLSPVSREGDKRVQENPRTDARAEKEVERQKLRARLQRQGQDTQKAVPEVRSGEGGNAPPRLQQTDARGMDVQGMSSGTSQLTDLTDKFHNVPRFTSVQEPKKVPLSRKERLAQQKQKMEAKKPELLPSETPGMEPQLATASPEPSTQKAAPKTEEPFTLTGPDVSNPKVKESGPEQLSIDVPPPTVGERPIIGREATHEEAPLFSKAAQEKDVEQTTLSEPVENPDDTPVIPKQDSGSSARSPAEILADALRTAADRIEGRNKYTKAKDGNLTDVGEELWYNKRNRAGKGIIWNDVKDLNATLKVKEVTKTRVWPRPDYEQLVEDGMHPFTAHLVKQIYDSIATAPSTNSPTDDKLQAYIETVQKLREAVFSWAKNLQQQRDLLDNMVGQAGAERSAQTFGSPVQISSLMKSTDYSIIRQVWPSPEGIGAFRDQKNKESLWLVGGNKLFGALQPGYDEAKRAIAALKEGWPAQQEAWQKRFTIKEVPVGEKIYSREGARTLTEPEFWIMRKSKASRFGNIVETGMKTREEAIEKAKSLAERKEKDGGEEEVPLNLEGLQRVGVERRAKGENISPAAFKDAFGFRGVNFGNWTNQIERQAHVNLAYDAFMDLAGILNIHPKALSLDGLLGVAFGAQGSGKYAAHFVPGVNEINLTKTRGAGALAHEWAHAVDHYFAAQAGEKYAKSTDPFLTHLSQVQSATIRAEVVDAFKTIVKTMKQRDQTAEEIKQGYSEKLARAEKGLRSWTDTIEKRIPEEKRGPVSKLIERINMGDVGDGYVKAGRDSAFRTRIHELREAYKVAMGHLLPKEEAQAIQNWGNSLEFARKAQSPQGHIPQKSTNYLVNAEKFDKDKGGKEYWTQPTELFARAFQSYVMDRLEAKAERNDYLTRPQKEDSPAYPQGEERTAINAAFDSLVGTLKTKETDKGIALFDERNSERAEPTMAQFAQAFAEGAPIAGTAQKVIDSSQEFPKEMIEALSAKRYVRQLTEELGKVFNSMKRVLVQSDPDTFRPVTFAALSPDSYYYGVNLRGPDQMILNPWTALHQVQQGVQEGFIGEEEVPEYLAGNLIKTLVHEFTHQQVTTTHQDERQPYFLAAEQRNRAILGSRLAMMQRQLMAVLTGGTNGAVEGIRADLTQQQAFWKEGDGLSAMDQSVSPEPSYARRRQGVSGEGASGRTGPPTYLRGSGESEALPLDESAGLRRSGPVTDSPAFKAWFKDSKVVDKNGKPLVVYHGTTRDFSVFEKGKNQFSITSGLYFTPHADIAGNFAQDHGGNVKPVYLSIQNPYAPDNYMDVGILSDQRIQELKAAGFDGAYFKPSEDDPYYQEEYVAFDPGQIKSATGNRGTFDPKDARIQFSKRTQETGTIDPTDARDKLAAVATSLRPYLLGSLGLEQLSQVYGNDHAEVKAYNKATQAMEADFTEMSRDSDKVARAWTDLNIPVADKMAKVMEDARFLNYDPDPRKKQAADSAKKQELRTRFEQLPEEAQSVYRMARDFYTNMAEQRFQALKERIERAGGTPENTRKFVDRLQIAYEQVRSKVYFPFTRFGENIVVAKKMENGVEKDREVHAFESVAESQKFATMMKLKGWQVKQTVAREYSVDKEGPASKIVRQMHDIIKELGEGQQGLPGVLNLEDQLLDSLNQSFLQALPDMSYAKHFIHAKDVKGASRDALRSFAHSALHGAHHISRIRHADTVTNALIKLDDKINGTTEGDTTEARQVYNELVKRHNDIMNPNTHPVSAWLGQLGFTMSLGGVVATGITNATQVPLVTYPWLGARYGFGKASAALARAYKDFLDPRTLNKDSLFDATKSKLISESERKMLLELARRGHIDLTQTMDLAGLSSRDNLSRKARTLGTVGEKVSRMLGFTFHVPEVMNRQVTALATFRLEKAKDGATFETALEKAQQAIQDTHFIYQAHNRPRYMSGNFLRVLTMFKQYSQNIAYTYGRAASIWLDKNHATKEERRVAKRQLASMLTLQFGAAGALGMPFFGTPVALIMHALGAMDDDDDQDWEVAFRQWLDGKATSLAEAFIDDKTKAREVGKEMAEVVSHGASRLTPWDMASRLGQNDLFFREPQREREGRSAVMDWMMALGGPVPSYGVNFLLGMGDVAKGMSELNAGFFMRGVEELTPAVLRHGVKSLRYTLEGVRTRDEYKQMDLNAAEKLGQIFGFTPARVAEMYESTTAVKNKEHRILNQQKALKDRFARAVDDQDDQAKQHILEDIRGFNERNPIFAITSNTLNRSIKTRRQHEAGMERGMYLPPRRRALLEEADFGDY